MRQDPHRCTHILFLHTLLYPASCKELKDSTAANFGCNEIDLMLFLPRMTLGMNWLAPRTIYIGKQHSRFRIPDRNWLAFRKSRLILVTVIPICSRMTSTKQFGQRHVILITAFGVLVNPKVVQSVAI